MISPLSDLRCSDCGHRLAAHHSDYEKDEFLCDICGGVCP